MKLDKKSMRLYAVTDRSWIGDNDFYTQIEDALKGGVTFLQLREKSISYKDFLDEAIKIKEIAARYNVPFVINDDVQIALESDADGVHIGQSDIGCVIAREKLGNNKIIGVSVQNVEQAVLAQSQGADYLGVGAMFSTSTKKDADDVSFETLQSICAVVDIPVVAIGGINEYNMYKLKNSGADGVAVVSAIFAAKDILGAAKNLYNLSNEVFE